MQVVTTKEEEKKLVEPDRFHLFVREDILGYKIVNFHGTPNGDNLVPGVRVLLHLQLPGSAKIFNSKSQQVIPSRDKLLRGQKYCTDLCRVEGVQFLGSLEAVKASLLRFQSDQGFLVSGWGNASKPFIYELGKIAKEATAGSRAEGCGPGLHFYTDASTAVQNFGGLAELDTLVPIITKRLTEKRGLRLSFSAKPETISNIPAPYSGGIFIKDSKPAGDSALATRPCSWNISYEN